MSRGRVVGIGAYVTVVLVLGAAVWWLIASGEGHDLLVDEALHSAEGQRERVEAWDSISLSMARDPTEGDRQTGLHVQDGEPEAGEEGIADVVRGWVRGLSAIATLLSILGWLLGLACRSVCKRT